MKPRLSHQEAEDGITTAEAVVLAPVLFALVVFMVFLGRVATTQQMVQRTARDAARSASMALTRTEAASALDVSLNEGLGNLRSSCRTAPIDYSAIGGDTGDAEDWDLGTIQVRISCDIRTDDLGLLGIPATKTFTAVATEPVDNWRSRPTNT